jgi:hypothetical protein
MVLNSEEWGGVCRDGDSGDGAACSIRCIHTTPGAPCYVNGSCEISNLFNDNMRNCGYEQVLPGLGALNNPPVTRHGVRGVT